MEIRLLKKEDWEIWKQFRLDALKNASENFGSSYEEEMLWSDLAFQECLTKSDVFGAFINDSLVSCAGFYALTSIKTKHRGVIWGMYTDPQHRKKGLGGVLLQRIITHAHSKVSQVHLTCVTSNNDAVRFYQNHGFKIYGTEPHALKIGEAFFDEYLMVLKLSE